MMWTTIELPAIAAIMSGFSYWFGVKQGFRYGMHEGAVKAIMAVQKYTLAVKEGHAPCDCDSCRVIKRALSLTE